MEYCLIGEKLGHSYSKFVHEKFGYYPYDILPLSQKDFSLFFENKKNSLAKNIYSLKGVNVTIPYKQDVMPHCAYIHPLAKKIGAVNTIVNRGGVLQGYNTDYHGLAYMIEKSGANLKGKTVLVLGSGGAAKTACAVANLCFEAGKVITVSRNGENGKITYDEALKIKNTACIINATPVGMYPNLGKLPIELAGFKQLEYVFDLIYNPLNTQLLINAKKLGITAVCGSMMLVAQAALACRIFTGGSLNCNENTSPYEVIFGNGTKGGCHFAPEQIANICQSLEKQIGNIVLIGMPACGKSSIGREIAQLSGKRLVDLDKEIEKKAGQSISSIFEEKGEDFFRDLETSVTREYAGLQGCVIATGGGIIKREENMRFLKQNGTVFYIKRDFENTSLGGNRPLSKNIDDLARLYEERKPLYEKAADYTVKNEFGIDKTALNIWNTFIK